MTENSSSNPRKVIVVNGSPRRNRCTAPDFPQTQIVERAANKCIDSFGDQPAAPEGCAEPIAEFRLAVGEDKIAFFAEQKPDASDRMTAPR